MAFRHSFVIIAALAAASHSARAQPDGTRVRAAVDTFHISRMEDGRPAAPDTLIQSLMPARWDGERVLLQVYRQRDFSGGVVLDSLWMHPRTLEPIRHSRRSSHLTADVRFTSRRITGRIVWADGRTEALDTLVTGPIYDAAASDLVARALPLTPGDTAHLTLYIPGYGANPMQIVLAGRETIRTHSGVSRPAWRLTGHVGGEPLTLWVATDNRDLLQLVAGDPAAPMKYVRQ